MENTISQETIDFYIPFLYIRKQLKEDTGIRREIKLIEKLNQKVGPSFEVEYKGVKTTEKITIAKYISAEEETALILTLHKIKGSKKSHLTPSKEELAAGMTGTQKDLDFTIKHKHLMDVIQKELKEYVDGLSATEKEAIVREYTERKKKVVAVTNTSS